MPNKRIDKRRISKREFLEGVKGRLENEVGIYLRLLAEKQAQDPNFPKVGCFAGVRLLMPVVDALSSVLMRSSRTDPRPNAVRFLERELEIEYPYVLWEMYRHSLIHTDKIRSLRYRSNRVSWGISIGLDGHFFVGGQTQVDITKLYQDLIAFLEREIPNATGHVYEEGLVVYNRHIPERLKREINDIQN